MRSQALSCALLLLLLTGCTGLTPVAPSPTPPAPTAPATDTPTPPAESLPTITTLRLWLPEELDPYGAGPGADILAQQLVGFRAAYPDLQVEVVVKEAHGRGGLLDFLRTARDAAPSILPDLVVLDAVELRTAAGSGLIQPLDPLLSQAEMNDRFPFAAEMGTADGQAFGVVVGADMEHLAYRPALLASPPVSWTQVISPPIPFLFPAGSSDGQVDDATLIQYLAAGGALTNSDGQPWLDEDALARVLDFYDACVHSDAISARVVLDIADADQSWEHFQAGEGVIAVVRASRYWLEADDTVAAAPIPTRDGYPLSLARGWTASLVATDPVRQVQALLLLEWLISPEHSAQWTRAAGYLPGTRSALRLWDASSADRAALRSLMEAAIAAPRPEVIADVRLAVQGAVEVTLSGQATPEKAAADAVDSLRQ